MTVSKIGFPATPPVQPNPLPAPTAAPAAKNDHDGDDGAIAATVASPPSGQGSQIDTKA